MKESPSKNVMMLAAEEGSFEEFDDAKPRKNVMQLTQVLNAQIKPRYTIKGRVCCS